MPQPDPRPISASERTARQRRASGIARRLGFAGRVEYRHVYSQAGGAQYGQAVAAKQDLLIVYAEAFERDADPPKTFRWKPSSHMSAGINSWPVTGD